MELNVPQTPSTVLPSTAGRRGVCTTREGIRRWNNEDGPGTSLRLRFIVTECQALKSLAPSRPDPLGCWRWIGLPMAIITTAISYQLALLSRPHQSVPICTPLPCPRELVRTGSLTITPETKNCYGWSRYAAGCARVVDSLHACLCRWWRKERQSISIL